MRDIPTCNFVHQNVEVLYPKDQSDGISLVRQIEYAGRNCYASQGKITDDSYKKFITSLIKRKHYTPLEFGCMTVDIITSRAVMAELTRHRLTSLCVESQRYVRTNTFVYPTFFDKCSFQDAEDMIRYGDMFNEWSSQMDKSYQAYVAMMKIGAKPEEAREVLPNSTACRIICSANLREWRHIFELRCDKAAYPQMRSLTRMLLAKAHDLFPIVFDDLYEEYILETNNNKDGVTMIDNQNNENNKTNDTTNSAEQIYYETLGVSEETQPAPDDYVPEPDYSDIPVRGSQEDAFVVGDSEQIEKDLQKSMAETWLSIFNNGCDADHPNVKLVEKNNQLYFVGKDQKESFFGKDEDTKK